MKRLIVSLFFVMVSTAATAAQWLVLTPADIDNIQIIQAGNSNGNPEGLYIGLKADIAGEAASYCARKNFVAISDPKQIDRVYSGLLFAISAQKTIQFYLDGSGKCLSNGPLVTMFTIKP